MDTYGDFQSEDDVIRERAVNIATLALMDALAYDPIFNRVVDNEVMRRNPHFMTYTPQERDKATGEVIMEILTNTMVFCVKSDEGIE
jgi:uncharacterized membrane protein YebE (DUF533 family)